MGSHLWRLIRQDKTSMRFIRPTSLKSRLNSVQIPETLNQGQGHLNLYQMSSSVVSITVPSSKQISSQRSECIPIFKLFGGVRKQQLFFLFHQTSSRNKVRMSTWKCFITTPNFILFSWKPTGFVTKTNLSIPKNTEIKCLHTRNCLKSTGAMPEFWHMLGDLPLCVNKQCQQTPFNNYLV